jgi:predicted RNase H-like nuclease (RuvC/YqgF family)
MFDNERYYQKIYENEEIENNKNEILRLKEEIKEKEAKIKELELIT